MITDAYAQVFTGELSAMFVMLYIFMLSFDAVRVRLMRNVWVQTLLGVMDIRIILRERAAGAPHAHLSEPLPTYPCLQCRQRILTRFCVLAVLRALPNAGQPRICMPAASLKPRGDSQALSSLTNITMFYIKFVVLRLTNTARSRLPVVATRLSDKRLQLWAVVPSSLVPPNVGLAASLLRLRSYHEQESITSRTSSNVNLVNTERGSTAENPQAGSRSRAGLGAVDLASNEPIAKQELSSISPSAASETARLSQITTDAVDGEHTVVVRMPLNNWTPKPQISIRALVNIRRTALYQVLTFVAIVAYDVAMLRAVWSNENSRSQALTIVAILAVIQLFELTRYEGRLFRTVVSVCVRAVASAHG
jgi:hypothetical protein